MARRPTDSLIFDSLRLEGGLFVPAVLEKAARGDHTAQKAPDYQLPKGLSLVDEQGRAFRIASALWKNFEATRVRQDIDAARATVAFASEFFRDALGYTDFTPVAVPIALTGRGYPITALASGGRVPVIIAPHALDLDTPDERFAIVDSGLRRRSAYQLAQQFLNASAPSMWALLTNGRQLRLVRDAETLARPAFLEADLELILKNQRYADFAAVWRLFHASRAGAPAAPGDTCVWETWKLEGQEQGERVRDGLRGGVTEALIALGTGFIEHRDNEPLRFALQSGDLRVGDYLQQLFRLIYRCLFLFTVEERGLLHVSDDSTEARRARDAYAQGYSFRRLRDRALRRAGFDRHHDLWAGVLVVFRGLARGEPRLALPALGGLFAPTQCPGLDSASLENRVLLTAMRHLRWSAASGQLAAIDYRNMDSEELGSVYESLLELVPTVDLPARRFGFVGLTDAGSTAGNARKTSGSYYTPDSLVQELIKSALDPVIAQKVAAHAGDPVEALLTLTVCDPSCGSGHFLLAAARRLAEKIAELRAPDGAVRPDDYRHALREVASRCLFGVDLNPMAVELCRVALWLETVDPGKPLGFLNHHIRNGNSLLGTTPELIAQGLPDDAFTAIEGDDKVACSELKKRNKNEREGFGPLFQQEDQAIRDRLRKAASAIEEMDDSRADLLQRKEAAFASTEAAPEYRHAKLLADLWCAAFVIRKYYPGKIAAAVQPSNIESQIVAPVAGHLLHAQDELFGQALPAVAPKTPKKARAKSETLLLHLGVPLGITTRHLRDFVQGVPLESDLQSEVEAVSRQFGFFHWHLAFPKIFERGGFDCILGNPPWDRVKFNEQDWFAERMPEIANAQTTAARKKLVEELGTRSPALLREFEAARREFEGLNIFIRVSGVFPNGSSGELNLATLFAERSTSIVGPTGQAGLVLPTTVVTDKSAQPLCRAWIEQGRLVAIFDFENRAGLFPEVHRSYKFAILTLRGSPQPGASIRVAFYLQAPSELSVPENLITVSVADIEEVNPNTLSFPVSRTAADAQLMLAIHRGAEPLLRDADSATGGAWGYSVFFVFEMNKDSSKFSTSRSDAALPLLEAKLVHQFEHRAATFEGQGQQDLSNGNAREALPRELADANFTARPRFWVPASEVINSFKRGGIERQWLLVARAITNATNERTVITCIIPRVGMGHSCWGIRLSKADAPLAGILSASLNSLVLDYAGRQKISGMNLSNFIIKQLPVLSPDTYAEPCPWASDPKLENGNRSSLREWFVPRLLELIYTAWDLESFATDCGWSVPPFRWDEERRFLLRGELDAAFFHLYLGSIVDWQRQPDALTRAFPTPRAAVAYIMDTFPILKRKDEAKHGGIYRTKETILQIYDALQESIRTGQPYQTRLDPPPADPRCCHPPRFNIPTPNWMDRPLVLPVLPRGAIVADLYRAAVVPHLLYQAGGRLGFDRFRRAYWLLTEPRTLQRFAKGEIGQEAAKWGKLFRERLEKDMFIPHLRSGIRHDLQFVTVDGERRLQLRRTDHLSDDEHVIFDARLALLVAELWPSEEPIPPLTQAEEAAIKELELAM